MTRLAAPAGGLPREPAATRADVRSRNDRILLVSMVAYAAVLAGLALERGVELTPAVLAIGVALVTVLALRRRLPFRDWIPFVVVALAYELIRGYQATLDAMVHVAGIIGVERDLLGGQLATGILQAAFHPLHGLDPLAVAATILYVLHVPLPLAVAGWLWLRHRSAFYDFVAALVVLSIAAFITYLLLPVAPPWWAAAHGYVPGPGGRPLISYLQPAAFATLVDSAGLDGRAVFGLAFGNLSPDQIASFPSIHAAYPFLAYLVARRVLGRARWLVLAYAVAAWFAIIYLGDHYLVDVIGGVAYSSAACWSVTGGPARLLGAIRSRAAPGSLGMLSP